MIKLPKENLLKFPTAIYFVSVFLIVLLALVYLIYEIHNQLKISAKKDFIGTASANLITTDQSLDELKNSLIANSGNYQTFTKESENFQKISLTEALKNNDKNLSQIETVKNNLVFQKDLIKETEAPEDYTELKIGLLGYFDKSQEAVKNLEEDFNIENRIYKILNSNLGNINIYNDELWQNGKAEDIIIFYQNLKNASSKALQELLSFTPPKKYENYYNLYISYLEKLESSSTEVTNALKVDDQDFVDDQANQLEVAFKASNDSQNELNQIVDEIKEERNKYFSQNTSLYDFSNLLESQQMLEDQIKNLYQQLYLEAQQKLIKF